MATSFASSFRCSNCYFLFSESVAENLRGEITSIYSCMYCKHPVEKICSELSVNNYTATTSDQLLPMLDLAQETDRIKLAVESLQSLAEESNDIKSQTGKTESDSVIALGNMETTESAHRGESKIDIGFDDIKKIVFIDDNQIPLLVFESETENSSENAVAELAQIQNSIRFGNYENDFISQGTLPRNFKPPPESNIIISIDDNRNNTICSEKKETPLWLTEPRHDVPWKIEGRSDCSAASGAAYTYNQSQNEEIMRKSWAVSNYHVDLSENSDEAS